MPWIVLAMQALVVLLIVRLYGWEVFGWGPVPELAYPDIETYARVPLLPANPNLSPLWLALTAIAAAWSLPDSPSLKIWGFLWIWLLVALASSLAKSTGELPFEGVRTALGAAAPFLLLSARGLANLWQAGVDRIPGGFIRYSTIAAAGAFVILTSVGPLIAAGDQDFNQQKEYRFVHSFSSKLPERSVLLFPDDLQRFDNTDGSFAYEDHIGQMFRMGYLLLSVQGSNPRRIKPLGIEDASLEGLSLEKGPVYYYRSLECFRTGGPELRPVCSDLERRHELEPVAVEVIENRMYTGDSIEQIRITRPRIELGLFRITTQKE